MIYYFGCAGPDRIGHHWYAPGLIYVYRDSRPPVDVDGTLAPLIGRDELAEGRAAYKQIDKWACVSFWDRSGDDRGGSNSTFALLGQHTFDEVLAAARVSFPQLFERFDFKIVEVRVVE